MVNVYNDDGQWVGFFYGPAAAAVWVSQRLKPAIFDLRSGPRDEDTPVARGIYPPKGDPRLKDADEKGFLLDESWPEPELVFVPKGGSDKGRVDRASSVEVPMHVLSTSRADDDVLDRAIRESLSKDRTDDNTREDVGLEL